MQSLSTSQRFVAVALIAATLFTFTDAEPAGTWPGPVAFVFWVVSVGLGLGLASAVAAALVRRPAWTHRPRWQTVALSGGVGLLLFTPLALGLDSVFPAPPESPDGWLDALEATGMAGRLLAELFQVGPAYLLTWGLINLAAPWPMQRPAATGSLLAGATPASPVVADSAPATAGPAPEVPLAPPASQAAAAAASDRCAGPTVVDALGWPKALGDEVLHVVADLHYLQVTTTLGRATVLGSLSAVERHFGDQGLRVHRSHWVAARAVRSVRRTGGGWVVDLHSGTRVPVSRRRVADVRGRLGVDFQRDSG